MIVRLYRASPSLRPVALLDVAHGTVRVERTVANDPLLNEFVGRSGGEAHERLRLALERGEYVLTRDGPDAFFRQAEVVRLDHLS